MAEETPKKKKGSTHVTHEVASQRDELVESLADVLNKANKDAGKCAFFLDQKEDPSTITDWISTGCDILDLAISNRPHAGIPVGRITEITGLEASGKSLLSAHLLAETQKKGGLAVFIDTEQSVSHDFLSAIGVDVPKMLYVAAHTVEDIFEKIELLISQVRKSNKDRLVTIVVDSVAAASTKAELEADHGKDGYATGKAIIYGDTDSCYFSAYKTLKKDIDSGAIPWTKETVIQLYDQIAEEVNSTFPQFMLDAFHTPKTRGEVIKAGREIVGSKSLFITKKRYAVLYYDKEGKRLDVDDKPGKIKAMGLDLKRSDTPEFIQNFLSDILEKVLTGHTETQVLDHITEFRTNFKARPGWEKGSPKRANNISAYCGKEEKTSQQSKQQ